MPSVYFAIYTKLQFESLLSNFGGQLGLWFGMSIMTLIEIGTLVVLLILVTVQF